MTPKFVRRAILAAIGVFAITVCQFPGADPVAAADVKKPEEAKVTFAKDIQPLLVEKCGNCHGTTRPKKGIDYVTSYETTMKTVKSGKPDESRLFRSIAGKGGKAMPPKKPLTEGEIAKIKAWIADGAKNN